MRQVMELFISANSRLSKDQPVYGIIVLVFIGSVQTGITQNRIFLICSIGFIICAALFTSYSLVSYKKNQKGLDLSRSRLFISIILFGIVALVTCLSGILLISIDKNYTRYMHNRMNLFSSTGYSNRAKLGSVLHRKSHNENKVALRVISQRNPIYLRAKAYNVYKSPIWIARSRRSTILPKLTKQKNLPSVLEDQNLFVLKEPKSESWSEYRVWATESSGRVMFMPGNTSVISALLTELEVDGNDTVVSKGQYKKNYTAFTSSANLLSPISDTYKEQFIEVPEDIHPDVIKLAEKLFQGCNDINSKIGAVENYFKSEYEYKLGIKIPDGADPLTHFLLEKPAAHCEYFATGAAILLRLAEVPCRYVAGYVLSDWNSLGKYWIARNRDAHAWVEAYDDNSGWFIVEATPPDGVPDSSPQGKAGYIWDYVKHCFQVFRASLSLSALKRFFSQCVYLFSGKYFSPVYIAVGLLPVLFILIGIYFGRRIYRKKRTVREKNPVITSLHRLLEDMDIQLKKDGIVRRPNETINQFADRILTGNGTSGQYYHLSQWYKEYASVRYGGMNGRGDLEKLRSKT